MAEARNRRLEGCRVLVAEAGHVVADDLKALFSEHRIALVGPISELSEAMRLVDDDGFDVAVIDLGLRDGLMRSLAEELERQQIPFVFAADEKAKASPARFGTIACWRKPLEPAAVLDHLKRLCERAARKIVPIDPKG